VWVRNIIWFILLIGIVMFSILLFLLVMDPLPKYQDSTGVQATETISKGNEESQGEDASSTETSDSQEETEVQEVDGVVPPKESAEKEANKEVTLPGQQQGKTTVSPVENEPQKKRTPPEQKAGGESARESTWYPFGQGIGYVALVVTLIPYILFSMIGRGRGWMRRLGRNHVQSLGFLSQLAIAIAALHGGMMLRIVETWDRHLLAGVGLFIFLVLFFLRASLYTPAASLKKNNPFPVLIFFILLLFVIHSIG
jgi:hypothetical protein